MIMRLTAYDGKKGQRARLLAHLALWLREMAKTPGFLGADTLRDVANPDRHALYSRWQSVEALESFCREKEPLLREQTGIENLTTGHWDHLYEEIDPS